ncbi:glycosyltransferase family 2 protein [Entomospira nematocerorum]|uniref:Glycosyltransferase family 2 protein n=1 Tax=Entomospira nematocerorum TaxID=2719987 RepID=A0A968KT87_9SPIO|nr:glycosyltransferase family 2 protein [Entomospira nematocera]NIZ47400.1 glycosyltransferase family 2 protein [Entomospira nematocera]WDI34060.1 glycosyltransferase family 2 protein [Entomospira nematocera]
MLLSIIVPFYRVELFLDRCLNSIIQQSYQNLEIILIDDCSPDNSITIAREYAARDSRIKIIEHPQNLGLGGARNSGLAVATGEYVWFVDSDDAISYDATSRLVDFLHEYRDIDVLVFGFINFIEPQKGDTFLPSTEVVYLDDHASVMTYLLNDGNRTTYYTGVTEGVCFRLYRRQFLVDNQFVFLRKVIHEDNITPVWFTLSNKVLVVPEVFYLRYVHSESITQSPPPRTMYEDILQLSQYLQTFYTKFSDRFSNDDQMYYYLMQIKLIFFNFYRLNYYKNLSVYEQQKIADIMLRQAELIFTNKIILEDALTQYPYYMASRLNKEIVLSLVNYPSVNYYQSIYVWKEKAKEETKQPPTNNQSTEERIFSWKKLSFRKVIKMLLPYGVVRYIQHYFR